MSTPLTAAEKKALSRFEDQISKGLDKAAAGFVEAGTALARVRDAKLYRATYANFDAYCWDKWGIRKSRAYQLIQAADCPQIVDNEAQARVLLGLDCAEAEAVVAVASADGPLTAAAMETAKQLLEAETANLNGKEKAKRQAEIVAEAEAKAEDAPPRSGGGGRKKRSRVGSLKGYMEQIRGLVARAKKAGAGLVDVIELIEAKLTEIVRLADEIDETAGTTGEED